MKYFIDLRLIIKICLFLFAISFTFAQVPPKDDIEEIKEAIVHVTVETELGVKNGVGTVIDIEDGKVYILTAFHVIEGWDSVAVQFFGQNEGVLVPNDNIKVDRTYDIALLIVPTNHSVEPVPIIRENSFNEEVSVSAYVWMLIPSEDGTSNFRSEYVSKITATIISFPIQVQRGWSGSPLFSKNGFLIGVLVGREGEFDTGRAARGDKVRDVIEQTWGINLKKQKLRIKVFPHAEVYIDSKSIGEIPRTRTQKIEVGKHTIEFVLEDLDKRYTVEVKIKARMNREIQINMITGNYEVKDLIQ